MKNNYSFGEIIKNILFLLYTKIFFRQARLIRLPFIIRGRRKMECGKGLTTGYSCRLEMFGKNSEKKLFIEENCKMGDYVHIAASKKVSIGKNCLIASKVYISDTSHGNYKEANENSSPTISPDDRPLFSEEVIIGDNVWIGENVCILPGSQIETGCIIGANSVVNSKIPLNSIAVGSPAKVIKRWNEITKEWEKV